MDLMTPTVREGFQKYANKLLATKSAGLPLNALVAAEQLPESVGVPFARGEFPTVGLGLRTSSGESRQHAADLLRAWRNRHPGVSFKGNTFATIKNRNAQRSLQSAADEILGKQVHTQSLHPTSAIERWKARMWSPDGALYTANRPEALVPGEAENNYTHIGEIARQRQDTARKLGYGGVGATAAGLLAYGLGSGHGQEAESKYIGRSSNKYLSQAPLHKRVALALNAIFRPHATGNQIQRLLD